MQVRDVLDSSFIIIESSWPVQDSAQLVAEFSPTHVIVHRPYGQEDLYYLFRTQEALAAFARVTDGGADVHRALDLHETDAVTVVAASGDAGTMPDRCIVQDDGQIVGLFDVSNTAGLESFPAPAPDLPTGAAWPVPGNVGATRGAPQGVGAAAVEEAAAAVPEMLTRYLTAEFPNEVALEETVSLLVSISGIAGSQGAQPFVLPTGTKIDIVIHPIKGFAIDGASLLSMQVTAAETMPLLFKVRGTALGPGQLRVMAFRDGQALAVVELRPTVVAAATGTSPPRALTGELAPAHARGPDLMLMIRETQVGGKAAFTLELEAPYLNPSHNFTPFGPVVLETEPLGYFSEFFADIEGYDLSTIENQQIAAEQLKAKGANLFQRLFPKDLQTLLWELRDSNLVIHLQSNEPWIPWELCRLVGEENGDPVDGPFLCEAFAITRWQPGISTKPSLSASKIALVVPADSGLALAATERDAILALADEHRSVERIDANFLALQRAFKAGVYDAWHFTGHGADTSADPNKAMILLERGQLFTADNLAGEVRRLGKTRPLVFLNACQTGRGGLSLTGMGGWARQFLAADAGAFIGTYWSVTDQSACDFAQALYAQLLAGEPVGKAMQAARGTIRNSGDLTWLAYTAFADPLATVKPAAA
jgi:Uncharacterized protein conserved in bacteria